MFAQKDVAETESKIFVWFLKEHMVMIQIQISCQKVMMIILE